MEAFHRMIEIVDHAMALTRFQGESTDQDPAECRLAEVVRDALQAISAFAAISVAASISFCISLMILICELCFPRDYALGSPDTIATDWDKIDNAEETE